MKARLEDMILGGQGSARQELMQRSKKGKEYIHECIFFLNSSALKSKGSCALLQIIDSKIVVIIPEFHFI